MNNIENYNWKITTKTEKFLILRRENNCEAIAELRSIGKELSCVVVILP